MKINHITNDIVEVAIDNTNGAGAVPYNHDVDYFGLRVKMRPSMFLKLALPLGEEHSKELEKYIADGGAIGSPFLELKIPAEWDDGDFSKFARVANHEGRNRMTAILKLEGDAAIEVHLLPRGGYRTRDLTPEFIKNFSSGLIAQGGGLVNGPLFTVSVTEGWKSTLGTAALAAGLVAGGGILNHLKPTVKTVSAPVTLPIQQAPKASTPVDILRAAATAAGITGKELIQFLAQCSHETLNFTRMEEVGSLKYFTKYETGKKAKILGNKVKGDGALFKGRGFIQLTGRDNYTRAGKALGLPLAAQPELAAQVDNAAKIAVWYWKNRVAPKVVDFGDTNKVTKHINPGMKGKNSRQRHFANYSQDGF